MKNYLFLLQIKYIDQFLTSINDLPKFLYNRLNKRIPNIQTILEGIHCSPPRNISRYNRINSKLLASRNYWLSLPVTDHDAANVHNLFACQSSRFVRHNQIRYNIASSVISCGYRCVGSTRPNCPIWQHQPGPESVAIGCEDRSTCVIESDAASRDQRFERIGMKWRPDGRHRTDFRIGTNKLRRRSNAGTRPLKRRRRHSPSRGGHPEKQRPRSSLPRRHRFGAIDISSR